ncbi:alanyl-tRNA editing protein [Metabacillus sp. GX 13764]|uniref:alanyl-tRNA editing protein n=1 Tax=Metabacillus kandeliae TaxID=2900151 RepID=UPI001E399D6D|nr:alanyl-tRNA editing protein [Metabacillus kandeliae]
MTRKLYYEDQYTKTFRSAVVKQAEEAGRPYAVLEETAFYPEGGGQPSDTGTLDGVRVMEVKEEEGEIRHFLEHPLKVKEAEGKVDWERRFDHMQQHSGQHILSAAFRHVLGIDTDAFHLGTEISTIDLSAESLTEEMAEQAESWANGIIFSNKPIQAVWVKKEELEQYPLHKQPAVEDNIRLVIIPEVDYNGCGGTHPNRTGETGIIKILNWEKHKKMTRVQFVCGGRVIRQLGQKQRVLLTLIQTMNSPEANLPEAAVKLLNAQKDTAKELAEAKDRLLEFEAEKAADSADGIVALSFENRPLQELQKLGRLIAAKGPVCLLTVKNGGLVQFFAAKNQEHPANLRKMSKEVLDAIGGKGGGSELALQGGGESALAAGDLLALMKKSIS